MWVDHFVFAIDATLPDSELLAGLLSCPEYAHDFASPYANGATVDSENRPIHARWWADLLTVQMFGRIDPAAARRSIHAWLDAEVRDPPQTPRTHARIDAVLDRALVSRATYRLDVPDGAELLHDDGSVVGLTGYQEYVTIDRASGTMHLLVASDD